MQLAQMETIHANLQQKTQVVNHCFYITNALNYIYVL